MKRGIVGGIGTMLIGAIAGGLLVKKLWLDKYRKQKEQFVLSCHERELLYNLLKLKQNGSIFSEYFEAHNLHSVAILGMGMEGRYVLDELMNENRIAPAYGVEADYFGSVHETLTVYRLGEDKLPLADCMVVCDIIKTREKIKTVQEEFAGTIVTLEEVVEWMMNKHKIQKWTGRSTSSRLAG